MTWSAAAAQSDDTSESDVNYSNIHLMFAFLLTVSYTVCLCLSCFQPGRADAAAKINKINIFPQEITAKSAWCALLPLSLGQAETKRGNRGDYQCSDRVNHKFKKVTH